MFRKVTILAAAALLAGITGCTTVQKGSAAGGALGALAGGIVGNNTGGATTVGIAIGGGAGAATGGLAGEAFAETTDQDAKREIENLHAELESAQKQLAELRKNPTSPETAMQLDKAKKDLDDLSARLDSAKKQLETAQADGQKQQAQIAQSQAEVAQRDADLNAARAALDDAKNKLASAQSDLTNKTALLDEANKQIGSAQDDLKNKTAALDDAGKQLGATQTDLQTARNERDDLTKRLQTMEADLAATRSKLNVVQTSLSEKEMANDKMKDELSNLNVKLEETSRGLTLTIVDQLLFKSGSADLTDKGTELIGQVSEIINKNFPNRELLVEGHTDNAPITHSKAKWQSNWELGSARALSVLHTIVEKQNFDPAHISATSFGEFRPAASNDTEEGRASNRRSVIVILPEKMPIQRNQFATKI